jgi:hypothetical protein
VLILRLTFLRATSYSLWYGRATAKREVAGSNPVSDGFSGCTLFKCGRGLCHTHEIEVNPFPNLSLQSAKPGCKRTVMILCPSSSEGCYLSRNVCTTYRVQKGKVRSDLTSVVGTNSDPSDEIHLWIIISFCLPRSPQVPFIARPVK